MFDPTEYREWAQGLWDSLRDQGMWVSSFAVFRKEAGTHAFILTCKTPWWTPEFQRRTTAVFDAIGVTVDSAHCEADFSVSPN